MIARKLLAMGLALVFLGGCTETTLTLKQFMFEPNVSGPLQKGYIYWVEAKGDIIMGAIIYRVENPGPNDQELIVIANGVTESMWRKIIPALISAGGQVAAAGIYGISIPAAKTVISTVAGGGTGGSATGGKADSKADASGGSATGGAGGQGGSSTASGGAGGSATNTNTNTATGGAGGQGGAGGTATNTNTSTNTATGGAGGSSTNTNTNTNTNK